MSPRPIAFFAPLHLLLLSRPPDERRLLFSPRWRLLFSCHNAVTHVSPQDDDDGGPAARSAPSRRRASFSSRDSDRTEQQAAVKRHASSE